MDWSSWRRWFEHTARRPLPDLAGTASSLPERLHEVMGSTLSRLQAGETGEGRIVHQVRQAGLGDADYHAAMGRFGAEEGRHARILGLALRDLGRRSSHDAWTARWSTVGRRLIGPRTKLLVLLSAEVRALEVDRRALAGAMLRWIHHVDARVLGDGATAFDPVEGLATATARAAAPG